jgi:hypothetical protein
MQLFLQQILHNLQVTIHRPESRISLKLLWFEVLYERLKIALKLAAKAQS